MSLSDIGNLAKQHLVGLCKGSFLEVLEGLSLDRRRALLTTWCVRNWAGVGAGCTGVGQL